MKPTHVDVAGRCSVGVDMVNEDPADPEVSHVYVAKMGTQAVLIFNCRD